MTRKRPADRLVLLAATGIMGVVAVGSLRPLMGQSLRFVRGDVNGDGDVSITDPIRTLNHLFLAAPEPPCQDAADVNDDGSIDVSDVVSGLRAMFLAEGAGAPTAACEPDATPDDPLGCKAYDACPQDTARQRKLKGTPPVPAFTVTPDRGAAPLSVELDATSSHDRDGKIVKYEWSFGDRQRGTSPRTEHVYSTPGEYLVTLTVTDDEGASASDEHWISVSAADDETTGNDDEKESKSDLVEPLQRDALAALKELSETPVKVRLNKRGVPVFLSGKWETDPSRTPGKNAGDFMKTHGNLFRLDSATDGLKGSPGRKGKLGFTNVRLEQSYLGIPVAGAEVIVHLRGSVVSFVNGRLVPGIDLNPDPGISSDDAREIALQDLRETQKLVVIARVIGPELRIHNPVVFDRFAASVNTLCWFLLVETSSPYGRWNVYVDAGDGSIVDLWNDRGQESSQVYDANGTGSTGDDDLWYLDHVQQLPGSAPSDTAWLDFYTLNYEDYLSANLGLNGIDDAGMTLVGRAGFASLSMPSLNACWDCRGDEAVFNPGMVTQDVVAHEYTHGLVEKMGGDLTYRRESGALNESIADTFAEYLECRYGGCNWLIGQDALGRVTARGILRDMSDPTAYSDPDHMSSFLSVSGSCNQSNDRCWVHVNSGIPNKVAYLIAQGGTHYGIDVAGIGLEKAEQLLLATLTDTGLTRNATFEEYRDVMLETAAAMVGGASGMTWSDVTSVHRAFCSVGLCGLEQPLAGALNEAGDRYGWALATGDFNGDSYEDLAIGVPYEDYAGHDDTGVVFVFYGSASGLTAVGSEIIHQGHVGALNESNDRFGWSLAVGNFNGDAYDDLAIGVPYEHLDGAADTGVVNIVFGAPSGLLSPGGVATWERITQVHAGAANEANDRFGWSLAVGNFNGDAYDDLAVGAPYEHIGSTGDAGAVSVFHGSLFGLLVGSSADATLLTQAAAGSDVAANDRFGWSLAAGQFDGIAGDDLAVGVPYESLGSVADAGVVNVFYSTAAGLLATPLTLTQNMVGGAVEDGDRFGWSLTVGNFNGDSRDDLAIGVPYEDYGGAATGVVHVVYGAAGGLGSGTFELLSQNDVAGTANEANDRFGFSLTVGRFNADGIDDLAVGVPFEHTGGESDNGVLMLFHGSASLGLLPPSTSWFGHEAVGGSPDSGDRFAYSLASGDFAGDGRDDIAIGAPWEDVLGENDVGAVFIDEN